MISLKFPRETLKLVLKFSSGVVGYQILANVLLLFERGWITRVLGSEVLTYYVVPMMLSLYIHSFISSLLLVLFPLASELKDDPDKLLNLYKKATKVVALLVTFLALTLIVQSHEFLTLWMGAAFADKSSSLLVIHTITFSLLAILTVSWQMTEGLGFPNYNFKIFSICLLITVAGIFALTVEYGSFGIAVARMIGFSTIFLSIFYVEYWFFKKVQIRLWLQILGILSLSALAAALVESMIINSLTLSWVAFLVSTFCGGIVYCLFVWIMGFITDEEKLIFRNILRR